MWTKRVSCSEQCFLSHGMGSLYKLRARIRLHITRVMCIERRANSSHNLFSCSCPSIDFEAFVNHTMQQFKLPSPRCNMQLLHSFCSKPLSHVTRNIIQNTKPSFHFSGGSGNETILSNGDREGLRASLKLALQLQLTSVGTVSFTSLYYCFIN